PGAVDNLALDRLHLELGAAMRTEECLGRHRPLTARTRLHVASVLALPTVPAPEMSAVSITIRIQDGIARITLNRPPLNVLDVEMLRRLNEALRECDATSIRVVVLRSALPRGFSAVAEEAGLATQGVPAAQLTERVDRLATDLAARSGVALHALTSATRGQRAPALLQRLDAAIATYRATVGPSRDAEEGISAFLEKRAPAWTHR